MWNRYATERLSTCIQVVTNVRDHLEQATFLEDADRVVALYVQHLTELEGLVRDLVGYCDTYLDQIYIHNESTAHRTPVVLTLRVEVGPALKLPGINWSTSHHCHLRELKLLNFLGFC